MNVTVALHQLLGAVSLNPSDVLGKTQSLVLRDLLLVLAAVGLVSALLLFWAIRYARRRKHHRHSTKPEILRHSKQSGSAEGDDGDAGGGHRSRRRRRHRRREHRGRNPTLAETGGLPPLRSDSPEKPAA